ncbi:MAG: hypothetical protein CVU98_06035 [Firmicutes bacterium HGW-Firmicutes-3]|jgi:hypothetical protein|nr:MAG: hypothetical protein CVU98_06035 [Firmicutes bacterium HGW-Firmicutes-3]
MSDKRDIKEVIYRNKFTVVIVAAIIPPLFKLIGNLGIVIIHMTGSDFWSFYGGYLAFLGTLLLGALTLKQNKTLSEQTSNQTNEIWKATETK